MYCTFSKDRDVDADLFRLFLEQAPEAIIFSDRHGIVRVWNQKAAEVFGYAADEILGENLDLLIPDGLCEGTLKGFRGSTLPHCAESGERLFTAPALRRDGVKIYVELALGTVLDSLARVVGCMVIARDISRHHRAELVVLKAETELHCNRSKSAPMRSDTR